MAASPSTPGGPPATGGGDPSMEDILASIRRILSEDEAESAAVSSTDSGRSGAPDVLTLDSSMLVEEPPLPAPPPQPEAARPADPPSVPPPLPPPPVAVAAVAPSLPPHVPEPVPVSEPPRSLPEPLLGAEAAAAATSSVGSLLRTLVAERQQVAVHRGGPTIEDMVREEVRPLLKHWLDTNLPPLVERLVRVEIERLVGRSLT